MVREALQRPCKQQNFQAWIWEQQKTMAGIEKDDDLKESIGNQKHSHGESCGSLGLAQHPKLCIFLSILHLRNSHQKRCCRSKDNTK